MPLCSCDNWAPIRELNSNYNRILKYVTIILDMGVDKKWAKIKI
jgi:hypothetical protein